MNEKDEAKIGLENAESEEADSVSRNAWPAVEEHGTEAHPEDSSKDKRDNIVKTHLVAYCENTSLHGFGYLPSAQNWIEFVLWCIVIIVALSIGLAVIIETFDYWGFNPTAVSVATYSYSVMNTQFPTVTFCAHQDYDRLAALRLLLNSVQHTCQFKEPVLSDVEYEDWMDFTPKDGSRSKWEVDLSVFEGEPTDYDYHDLPYDPAVDVDSFRLEYAEPTDCRGYDNVMDKRGPIAEFIKGKFGFEVANKDTFYESEKYFKPLIKAFVFISNTSSAYDFQQMGLKFDDRFMGKPFRIKNVYFNYSKDYPEFDKEFETIWADFVYAKYTKFAKEFNLYERIYGIGRAYENLGSHLQCGMHSFFFRTLNARGRYFFAPHVTMETQPVNNQPFVSTKLNFTESEWQFLEYSERLLRGLAGSDAALNISLHDLPGIFVHYDNFNHMLEWRSAFIYSYKQAERASDATDCMSRYGPSIGFMKCLAEENYFGKKLTPHREAIMKVLRVSEVIGNAMLSSQQHHNIVGDMKYLEYAYLRHDLPVKVPADEDHELTPAGYRVPKAQFQRDSTRLDLVMHCEHAVKAGRQLCKDEIHHVTSSYGICSAYNTAPLRDVFRQSSFVELLEKYYHIKPEGKPVLTTMGAGPRFSLKLVLDLHSREIAQPSGTSFSLALNGKNDFFDLSQQGFILRPGSDVQILVDGSYHRPTKAFEELPFPDGRSCKHSSEVAKASIFKVYTQKGCFYECSLRHSIDACGCVPWNSPSIDDSTEICDGYSAKCFESEMFNSSVLSDACDCPAECSQTVFSPVINTFELNYRAFCLTNLRYETVWPLLSPEDIAMHRFRNQSFGTLLDYKRNDWFHQQICHEKAQEDLVSVEVLMKTAFIQHIEESIRVSLMDKIGILGGTFGLFTGLSIISFFEIAFWIYRLVAGLIKSRRA